MKIVMHKRDQKKRKETMQQGLNKKLSYVSFKLTELLSNFLTKRENKKQQNGNKQIATANKQTKKENKLDILTQM